MNNSTPKQRFVDGTSATPPYIAIVGERYETFISDYSLWRLLEGNSTDIEFSIMGLAGKKWIQRDTTVAAKPLTKIYADHRVITHDMLAKFPPEGSAVVVAGDVEFAVIPRSALTPEMQTVTKFLSIEVARDAPGIAISVGPRFHWLLPSQNFARLPRIAPPPLTLTLRREGWMISVRLEAASALGEIFAREYLVSTGVPSKVTLAELPSVIRVARDLNAEIDADFDLDNPSDCAITLRDIPGWGSPTSAGRSFFPYQRDGIEFALARGGRALIADDMGLGKTAQALGVAAMSGAERIVVVAPAALRNVWRREIEAWDIATESEIHAIEAGSSAGVIPSGAKVVLTSYDLISSRALSWREPDGSAFGALLGWIKPYTLGDNSSVSVDSKKQRITLRSPIADADRAPIPSNRKAQWSDLQRRLTNPRLAALTTWHADVAIYDELHHAKNPHSLRAEAAIRLSESASRVVGLSGTPIQNRPDEGAQLVRMINPGRYADLRNEHVSIERCREMLGPISIRRLKEQVLAELPELTEQLIELPGAIEVPNPAFGPDDAAWQEPLDQIPQWAVGLPRDIAEFSRWIPPNLGRVSSMRAELGVKKAERQDVVELIAGMISAGPLIVFAAHHAVIDSLAEKLGGITSTRVVGVDGRTPVEARVDIVDSFQRGEIDCLVAGMDALGEGVTLTRASRVVFVETAWKPKTYQQARDRVRRIGQPSAVHAIYLIAPHGLDYALHAMATHKAGTVSAVQAECVEVLGARIRGSVEQGRLQIARDARG